MTLKHSTKVALVCAFTFLAVFSTSLALVNSSAITAAAAPTIGIIQHDVALSLTAQSSTQNSKSGSSGGITAQAKIEPNYK